MNTDRLPHSIIMIAAALAVAGDVCVE